MERDVVLISVFHWGACPVEPATQTLLHILTVRMCCVVSHFHFSGLKLLLEPILQGVLETKFEYMMDFDEYFRRVKVISQRRVSEHVPIGEQTADMLCWGTLFVRA